MEEGKVVEKMWGTETYLTNTDQYCCKRLHVYDGYVCSRHRHLIKTETFIIESGSGWIEVNARMYKVTVGDHLHIPAGTWHRCGAGDQQRQDLHRRSLPAPGDRVDQSPASLALV
jgi:mannose-6-phosphate isomerase-like protein (cupin superfamily)